MQTQTPSNSTQRRAYRTTTLYPERVLALGGHCRAPANRASVTEILLDVISNYALVNK